MFAIFYCADNETNRIDLLKIRQPRSKTSIALFGYYYDYDVTGGTQLQTRFHNTCHSR